MKEVYLGGRGGGRGEEDFDCVTVKVTEGSVIFL